MAAFKWNDIVQRSWYSGDNTGVGPDFAGCVLGWFSLCPDQGTRLLLNYGLRQWPAAKAQAIALRAIAQDQFRLPAFWHREARGEKMTEKNRRDKNVDAPTFWFRWFMVHNQLDLGIEQISWALFVLSSTAIGWFSARQFWGRFLCEEVSWWFYAMDGSG